MTSSGEQCTFPFVYNSVNYYSCIISGPNNTLKLPQCITPNGVWSFCQVPTNATISYATTRKGTSSSINSASVNGGTLLWIAGYSNILFSNIFKILFYLFFLKRIRKKCFFYEPFNEKSQQNHLGCSICVL